MLDLRRVRVFFEVAERRSFSAAAAALDYTQPSVSHHVSAPERELGQRLINRGTRPLSLTQAGEGPSLLTLASGQLADLSPNTSCSASNSAHGGVRPASASTPPGD